MARAVQVATGTADVQGYTGATTLMGVSARESASTPAAATVTLRNGTSASDPAVALIELAANGSSTFTVPAIDCPNGVFIDRSGGETELVLYIL